jgi:alkanesulfonate monooxygenase SsuD/methylene tetrahydromethanopterin reductase-like flavin-dependent oxidoreductase (luciferase family)
VQKLIDDGVMIAGGPDEVASLICKEQEALGFELMLANVYAAGVEQERVQRTISLFAGPVRERVAG